MPSSASRREVIVVRINLRKRAAESDLEDTAWLAKRAKVSGADCDVVTILVGKARQPFYCGKASLCGTSKMLRSACKVEWRSGARKEIDLHFIGPRNFKMFLSYIREGNLENNAYLLDRTDVGEEDGIQHETHTVYGTLSLATPEKVLKGPEVLPFDCLLQAFCMADFLQAEGFQNAVMDEMVKFCRFLFKTFSYVVLYPLRTVWERLTAHHDSPLRRVLLDLIFSRLPSSVILQAIREELIPHEMSLELMMLGFDRKSACQFQFEAPWERNPCSYHVHANEEFGYRCHAERFRCCQTSPSWDSRFEWDEDLVGELESPPPSKKQQGGIVRSCGVSH